MRVDDYIVSKIVEAFTEVEGMIPEMSLAAAQQEKFRLSLKGAREIVIGCTMGAIQRATLDTMKENEQTG